jgi:uncharacterized membrane protein YeiB
LHCSDPRWQPTPAEERYVTLDVLRGLALFGVLLINLETLFRVSLFEHILSLRSGRVVVALADLRSLAAHAWRQVRHLMSAGRADLTFS